MISVRQVIPFSVQFPSGDEVILAGIPGRVAAVGRTRIDNGDKEEFHAVAKVSLQRYKDVSPLKAV